MIVFPSKRTRKRRIFTEVGGNQIKYGHLTFSVKRKSPICELCFFPSEKQVGGWHPHGGHRALSAGSNNCAKRRKPALPPLEKYHGRREGNSFFLQQANDSFWKYVNFSIQKTMDETQYGFCLIFNGLSPTYSSCQSKQRHMQLVSSCGMR